MTIKCYNKPNRRTPRTFNAKDVGRIACAAIENGEDEKEIIARVAICIPKLQELLEKVRDFKNKVAKPIETAIKTIDLILDYARQIEAIVIRIPILGTKLKVIIILVIENLEKVRDLLQIILDFVNLFDIENLGRALDYGNQ